MRENGKVELEGKLEGGWLLRKRIFRCKRLHLGVAFVLVIDIHSLLVYSSKGCRSWHTSRSNLVHRIFLFDIDFQVGAEDAEEPSVVENRVKAEDEIDVV